jgi:hypothetical protein
MKRRDVMALIAGAAALPHALRGRQHRVPKVGDSIRHPGGNATGLTLLASADDVVE